MPSGCPARRCIEHAWCPIDPKYIYIYIYTHIYIYIYKYGRLPKPAYGGSCFGCAWWLAVETLIWQKPVFWRVATATIIQTTWSNASKRIFGGKWGPREFYQPWTKNDAYFIFCFFAFLQFPRKYGPKMSKCIQHAIKMQSNITNKNNGQTHGNAVSEHI